MSDVIPGSALVTGGGSGIGRAIALALAAGGAPIAVVDLFPEGGRETVALITDKGGRATFVEADVSRWADVDRAVSAGVRDLGPLGILVNAAGILDGYQPIDELAPAVFERLRPYLDRSVPSHVAVGDQPLRLLVAGHDMKFFTAIENHFKALDGVTVEEDRWKGVLAHDEDVSKELVARGSGPYFYLPKLESHLEARLWNDVFVMAQDELGIPRGTIKATVLIETILAAFEMDEILYELRDHSAGLNAGRWDYIFSCIKKFQHSRDFCLADRALVTMTTHFMRSYAELLVKTCHRRNIHAMGGMAPQIPVKNDEAANREAFAKVKADKEREATIGHDGTWVAHPALVPVAKEAFDRLMPTPNQIAQKKRADLKVTAADLLHFEPEQPITEKGLRLNINVAIQYVGAWLAGQGAVPIFNLMEDAATAEISRSQVWQWIRSPKGKLDDGRKVSKEMVAAMIPEEIVKIRDYLGPAFDEGKYDDASKILADLVSNDTFVEFLTLPAYERID